MLPQPPTPTPLSPDDIIPASSQRERASLLTGTAPALALSTGPLPPSVVCLADYAASGGLVFESEAALRTAALAPEARTVALLPLVHIPAVPDTIFDGPAFQMGPHDTSFAGNFGDGAALVEHLRPFGISSDDTRGFVTALNAVCASCHVTVPPAVPLVSGTNVVTHITELLRHEDRQHFTTGTMPQELALAVQQRQSVGLVNLSSVLSAVGGVGALVVGYFAYVGLKGHLTTAGLVFAVAALMSLVVSAAGAPVLLHGLKYRAANATANAAALAPLHEAVVARANTFRGVVCDVVAVEVRQPVPPLPFPVPRQLPETHRSSECDLGVWLVVRAADGEPLHGALAPQTIRVAPITVSSCMMVFVLFLTFTLVLAIPVAIFVAV